MTKKQLDRLKTKTLVEALCPEVELVREWCNTKVFSLTESRDGYIAECDALREENQKLRADLAVAVEALKFECGSRCAEQNPCNAKEVLSKIRGVKNK